MKTLLTMIFFFAVLQIQAQSFIYLLPKYENQVTDWQNLNNTIEDIIGDWQNISQSRIKTITMYSKNLDYQNDSSYNIKTFNKKGLIISIQTREFSVYFNYKFDYPKNKISSVQIISNGQDTLNVVCNKIGKIISICYRGTEKQNNFSTTYNYDSLNHVIKINDDVFNWQYDSLRNIFIEKFVRNDTLISETQYDKFGNRIFSYHAGFYKSKKHTYFYYDNMNRITQRVEVAFVDDFESEPTTHTNYIEYDNNSAQPHIIKSSYYTSVFTYNNLGFVTEIKSYEKGTLTSYEKYHYSYFNFSLVRIFNYIRR